MDADFGRWFRWLLCVGLAAREVHIAGLVPEPNAAWMLQVGRNLIDPWSGFLQSSHSLIYDRVAVFSETFRQLLRSAQVERLRLPEHSPNLNAHAERVIRIIREEYLDRMIFFGETALLRAVDQFVIHYHQERNHQALTNQRIRPEGPTFPVGGIICRRQRIGGLLNSFFREEAA